MVFSVCGAKSLGEGRGERGNGGGAGEGGEVYTSKKSPSEHVSEEMKKDKEHQQQRSGKKTTKKTSRKNPRNKKRMTSPKVRLHQRIGQSRGLSHLPGSTWNLEFDF